MSQNYEWIAREVRIPEGAFLATSHDTPGAERALLFDRESSSNLGPAELRVPEGEGLTPGELLAAVAILAVGMAVQAAITKAPEIKRGLNEKVLPSIKAKWNTFRVRGADSQAAAPEDESPDAAPTPLLTLVENEDGLASGPGSATA